MSSRLLLSDFATPYDIMVGFWAKQSIMYDSQGEYIDSIPGSVAVYWKKKGKIIHFREDLLEDATSSGKRYAHHATISKLTRSEFDLTVKGKFASGGSPAVQVTGREARPDVYHFHLKISNEGHWYNTHYFLSQNERHIMGPFVPAKGDGEIAYIVTQTLTRVSYEIPKRYKRDLRPSS
jgi:hypothetical protein